jgi:hypothetical protein
MSTPASKEYAGHILLVHERITDTEPLKDHSTDELQVIGRMQPVSYLGSLVFLDMETARRSPGAEQLWCTLSCHT